MKVLKLRMRMLSRGNEGGLIDWLTSFIIVLFKFMLYYVIYIYIYIYIFQL